MGVHPKPENCVFTPIPCDLRFNDAERSGCAFSRLRLCFRFELRSHLHSSVDLLTNSLSPSPSITSPSTDLEVLERSVQQVMDMLDRVLTYVKAVLAGETKGDPVVGRYLLDTFSTSTEGLDQGSFTTSLQVRLSGFCPCFVADRLLLVGHSDDLVPREPCESAGRGICAPTASHSVIAGHI